jgi:hypothetical protein
MRQMSLPMWVIFTMFWAFLVGMGIFFGQQAGELLKERLDGEE